MKKNPKRFGVYVLLLAVLATCTCLQFISEPCKAERAKADNTPDWQFFIVDGASPGLFSAYKDTSSGLATVTLNVAIQTAINGVRNAAVGYDPSIVFGLGEALDIGSDSLTFENSGASVWGIVTLKGSIKSSRPIVINDVTVYSKADIAIANINGIRLDNAASITVISGTISADEFGAMVIVNQSTGSVNVKGGTILAEGWSSIAVCNTSSGDINITGGTLSATGVCILGGWGSSGLITVNESDGATMIEGQSDAIAIYGGAAGVDILNISGGTVTSATHVINNHSSGTINISGSPTLVAADGGGIICSDPAGSITLDGNPTVDGHISVYAGQLSLETGFTPKQIYMISIDNLTNDAIAVVGGSGFLSFFELIGAPITFFLRDDGAANLIIKSDTVIAFSLNNGTGDPVPTSIFVAQGDTVPVSQKPTGIWTRNGYTTDGEWYMLSGSVYTLFVFGATTVDSSITLYLKWTGGVTINTTSPLADGTFNSLYSATVDASALDTSSFTFTVTSGTLPIGLEINPSTGEISGTVTGNAGNYIFTITVTGSTGGSESREFSIVINKAVINLPTIDSGVLTYNAALQNPNLSYDSGLCSVVFGSTLSATNAGMYYIEIEIDDPANYMWSDTAGGNVILNWSIGKAELTVVADSKMKVFGESDPELTFTFSGFKGGDSSSLFQGALSRAAGDIIGSYAITRNTLDAGSNYSISFTGAFLTITRVPVALPTIDFDTYTYNALSQGPVLTWDSVLCGIVSGSTLSSVIAGSYYIEIALDDPENYMWADMTNKSITLEWSIGKATLKVTANPKTKVYGVADPDDSYTYSGFLGDDTPLFDGFLSRLAGENVGIYEITLGTLSAGGNYTIDFTSADLTITKAMLVVIANNKSRMYGTNNPAFDASFVGFAFLDTASSINGSFNFTTVAGAASIVGAYMIKITAGTATSWNYNFQFTDGTLTITHAMAMFAPNLVTTLAPPNIVVRGSGGDTLEKWELSGGWTWEEPDFIPPKSGKYMIYLDVADLEINYDFSGVDGYLVDKSRIVREITVTLSTDGNGSFFIWFSLAAVTILCLLFLAFSLPQIKKDSQHSSD